MPENIDDKKATVERPANAKPQLVDYPSNWTPLQKTNADFWKDRARNLNVAYDDKDGYDSDARDRIRIRYSSARNKFDKLVSGKDDAYIKQHPETSAEEYGDGMALLLEF